MFLVETPKCVRRDLTTHVTVKEYNPFSYTVGGPGSHHFIREQNLLHILIYAPEVPRLLLLQQRVDSLAASDEPIEHPIHSGPRNPQLVTHLSHCANLPTEPIDRAIASHNDSAAVSIVEPLVQLLM